MAIAKHFHRLNIGFSRNLKNYTLLTIQVTIMNAIQQKQLLNDLTPAQAETAAGGAPPIEDRGANSNAYASYGAANATEIFRSGRGSFIAKLFVKDRARDGHPVYAKFHGLTKDGRTLIGSTQYFDLNGAGGSGTRRPIKASFGNIEIQEVRVAIYRRSLAGFVAGPFRRI